MALNKKHLMYAGLAVLVAVAGYFAWKKYKGNSTVAAVGGTYTDSDITKQIGDIKGDTNWYATVKAKATANGNSVEEQLRLDAIYMLEVVQKRTKI